MPRIAATLSEIKGSKPHRTKLNSLEIAPRLERVAYPAQRLNAPVSTIYQMVKEGRIPGVVKVGRAIRFDVDKLEAWIANGGDAR